MNEGQATWEALRISHAFPGGFAEEPSLSAGAQGLSFSFVQDTGSVSLEASLESQKCFPRGMFILYASLLVGLAQGSHMEDPQGGEVCGSFLTSSLRGKRGQQLFV